MIYPKFLKKNDTIGICCPSAGLGHKLEAFDASINIIEDHGYKVKETKSCRVNNKRSANAKQRAKEFDELVTNKNINMIMFGTGGDYMLEILPYINWENIQKNPKWMIGMSDPTNLLFTITTCLDVATFYGHNGGGYSTSIDGSKEISFDYFKGDIHSQKSYKGHFDFIDSINDNYDNPKPTKWLANKEQINIKGRLIGGCLEVIEKIIGTKYDNVNNFIEKYKNDGIIWYFDVFSDSSYMFYLTLLQFKNAGWFKYSKGVIIGRVAFPKIEDPKLDYTKAARKALGSIPIITEADIGHTDPGMTLINGSIAEIKCKDGKGSISFKLK